MTAAGAAPRLVNPAKRRMQADELALGLIVRVARSVEIARIAAATGHDFLFIDAQHAAFSPETVGQIAQAAHGSGVAPIVRVRGCDDPNLPLYLDVGATGIIVPDVNSAEEARRAARAGEVRADRPALPAGADAAPRFCAGAGRGGDPRRQ